MNDMLKDELYHKWTDATKANYNREYYQKHKDWWKTKYADFTGGVKRAAANAKETVKGETPQSLWKSGARDIQKNLPELKKGISSNAKTLAERAKRKTSEAIGEAKWQADRLARKSGADKAKALWDDGANDIKKKLGSNAKKAKALWDDGAKDIKSKAYKTARNATKKVHDAKVDVEWAINNNDAVGNVKRKTKAAKNLWDDGAKDIKSKAGKAASSARKGAKKLSSQLQKNGKQLMSDVKKKSAKTIASGKKVADSVAYKAAFSVGFVKGFVGGFAGEMKKDLAKSKKR